MKYPVEIEFRKYDYRLFDSGKNFVCKTDSEEKAEAIRDALNAMIRQPEPKPEWPKCFKWYEDDGKQIRYLVFYKDVFCGSYFDGNGNSIDTNPSWSSLDIPTKLFSDHWQPCPLPPEIIEQNPQLFGVKSVKDSMKPGESYERDGVTVGVTQPTAEPETEERFYRWMDLITESGKDIWQWMGFVAGKGTAYNRIGEVCLKPINPWPIEECQGNPSLAILEPTIPEPIRLQREKAKIGQWYKAGERYSSWKYAKVESDNAKLRDDYKVAKISHAKMQNLYIKMQNALSAAQAEKIELDGMFATLEAENAGLKEQISDIHKTVSRYLILEEGTSLIMQLEALGTNLDSKVELVEELESEITDRNDQIDELEAELAEKNELIDRINNDLNTVNTTKDIEIKQLEDKLAASESENFARKNQTETLENRISEMNSSFQAISKEWETKIAAVELTKRELIKDLAASIEEVSGMNEDWHTLEEEYKQKLATAEADAKTDWGTKTWQNQSFKVNNRKENDGK